MKLNIKDRLYIPQLLPANGNFTEFSLKRSILGKVGITAEDQEKFQIKEIPEENRIVWDSDKDLQEPLEVDFTAQELDFIRKGCEALVDTPKPDDFWLTVEKLYNK